MSESSFTNNGIHSSLFFITVTESDHLKRFEKDIELIPIDGRSGDLLVDNKRKKNKEINVKMYAEVPKEKSTDLFILELEEWLQGEVSYKPLVFDDALFMPFLAYCRDIDIKEPIHKLLEIDIKFTAKEG